MSASSSHIISIRANKIQDTQLILLPAGFHNERKGSTSSLPTYHRRPWRPTHNRRRCPNIGRLSRPLHWRRYSPHDHLPSQSKKRTQVPHVGHDVRLLHGKSVHHGTAHHMGQLPQQYQASHRRQHLRRCGCRPALSDQPSLCPTHNPRLPSQRGLASILPLGFYKPIRRHCHQSRCHHHSCHPELLHTQRQHQTHRPRHPALRRHLLHRHILSTHPARHRRSHHTSQDPRGEVWQRQV